MVGWGGIQNIVLVSLERAGSLDRYLWSVTGDDIVTSKWQEGKYGSGKILAWLLCLALRPCTVTWLISARSAYFQIISSYPHLVLLFLAQESAKFCQPQSRRLMVLAQILQGVFSYEVFWASFRLLFSVSLWRTLRVRVLRGGYCYIRVFRLIDWPLTQPCSLYIRPLFHLYPCMFTFTKHSYYLTFITSPFWYLFIID